MSIRTSSTNDLALLRVLVAQWIEHPPGVRKVVDSNPVMGSEFFLSIIDLKRRHYVAVVIYSLTCRFSRKSWREGANGCDGHTDHMAWDFMKHHLSRHSVNNNIAVSKNGLARTTGLRQGAPTYVVRMPKVYKDERDKTHNRCNLLFLQKQYDRMVGPDFKADKIKIERPLQYKLKRYRIAPHSTTDSNG